MGKGDTETSFAFKHAKETVIDATEQRRCSHLKIEWKNMSRKQVAMLVGLLSILSLLLVIIISMCMKRNPSEFAFPNYKKTKRCLLRNAKELSGMGSFGKGFNQFTGLATKNILNTSEYSHCQSVWNVNQNTNIQIPDGVLFEFEGKQEWKSKYHKSTKSLLKSLKIEKFSEFQFLNSEYLEITSTKITIYL